MSEYKVDLTRTRLNEARFMTPDLAEQDKCGFEWEYGMFMVFTGHGLDVVPSQPQEGEGYDHRLFAGMLTLPARNDAFNMYRVYKHAWLLYTKLFTCKDYTMRFAVGEGVALGPRGCVVPIEAHRAPTAIGRVLELPSETDPYLVISCIPAWG